MGEQSTARLGLGDISHHSDWGFDEGENLPRKDVYDILGRIARGETAASGQKDAPEITPGEIDTTPPLDD